MDSKEDLFKKPSTRFLEALQGPEDLKALTDGELQALTDELRFFVLTTIADVGGHLAASLGVVELTVGLHHVFNSPEDSIVWDVGHQAYGHKVLTGRRDQLATIKKYKGLSPFLKRSENKHDVFGAGHSSTSISAALGIAEAQRHQNKDNWVVSVIGDNAMTAGMAFEALNNVGHIKPSRFLVVFNDNGMGIDPNVGALQSLCQRAVTSRRYSKMRLSLKNWLKGVESQGLKFFSTAKKIRTIAKDLFTPGMLYESLGFRYVGPIDGNNLDEVLAALRNIKEFRGQGPVLLHALTVKGKGYVPAENDPLKYHGVGKFNWMEGVFPSEKPGQPPAYTTVFSETLVRLAREDSRVVGITAAMPTGTGLLALQKELPAQFYDVGIAEQHAVTFAAGLATQGMKPVCAIYSTFLQRAYDQVLHDVALQNLPVVFALDRGGVVGADGPTHHGVFDFAYLRHIPNMVIMAPSDENELQHMLYSSFVYQAPVALRYPRGNGTGVVRDSELRVLECGRGYVARASRTLRSDVALIAVGTMVNHALKAAEMLEHMGYSVCVINARFVKPLDEKLILSTIRQATCVFTIEDHVEMGGFGSAVLEMLNDKAPELAARVKRCAFPDEFVEHASPDQLYTLYGLDAKGIAERASQALVKDFVLSGKPQTSHHDKDASPKNQE